eukprot:11827703-Karenia_brevis.AAC.1
MMMLMITMVITIMGMDITPGHEAGGGGEASGGDEAIDPAFSPHDGARGGSAACAAGNRLHHGECVQLVTGQDME